MKISPELVDLSFSVFTRYQALRETLDLLRQENEVLKVLEIGGRGNYLRRFSPNDQVTILDVIDSDEENYVKGDGRKLPFKKGSFDVVVSTDVLEHIPTKDRTIFLNEQLRVAKRAVIFAGPIFTKSIADREKEADQYYQSMADQPHPWLVEHLDYGLPTNGIVESVFSNAKASWTVWYNQVVPLWHELVMVDMAVAGVGTPAVLTAFKSLNKLYNERVYPYDRDKSGYRAIYVARTDGGQAPEPPLAKNISQLPAKDLLALFQLITKLIRLIQGHYQTVLKHAEARGRAVEDLSTELERMKREQGQILTDFQSLKDRLTRIEASKAYRMWQRFKRVIPK